MNLAMKLTKILFDIDALIALLTVCVVNFMQRFFLTSKNEQIRLILKEEFLVFEKNEVLNPNLSRSKKSKISK